MVLLSLLAAIALAGVHLIAGRLAFLRGAPRSRLLSLAGGVSVAYVFVRLLPELSAGQEVAGAVFEKLLAFLDHHIYLISLVGLVTFYGLEKLVQPQRAGGAEREGGTGVFWVHIASFAFYNALIGYLLVHRVDPGPLSLIFFSVALGLHFFVNDYALREAHRAAYEQVGQWILALALMFGWAVGILTRVSDVIIAVLTSFLVGGIILNTLKEELPEGRESRFVPFLLGALIYAVLLLVV